MQDILVSFNNTYQSPGYPSLGLLNADTLSIRIIHLPPEIPSSGFLGLALSSKFIFAGLQYTFDATRAYRTPPGIGLQYSQEGVLESRNPCSLLVFDRFDFRLITQYHFQVVKDVHSFLLNEDEQSLYVVSTGSDEIVKVIFDGSDIISEKTFWRPEPDEPLADIHHLNSICEWNGDMIVSGFGKKEIPDDWNSAKNGFVYNVSKGIILIDGLQQPHSLAVINGQLAFCESKEKRVRFLYHDEVIEVEGYSRGMCVIDNAIFIGTSTRRQQSKSTGKPNRDTTTRSIGCTIRKVAIDNHDAYAVMHLTDMAHEIYELLPVTDTRHWPFHVPVNYKQQFEKAWHDQRELSIKEIHSALSPSSNIIIVDDNALTIESERFAGHRIFSFIEKDGLYYGPPENDEVAIELLRQLIASKKPLLFVFLWPSFWWLKTYPRFAAFIESNLPRVQKSDRVLIYASL